MPPFDALAVAAPVSRIPSKFWSTAESTGSWPSWEKWSSRSFIPFPRRDLWLLFLFIPRFYRSHLIEKKPASLRNRRPFACYLRKYLQGGRFLEVSQPPSERILHFKIENYNAREEGLTVFTLIFEATGRVANLVLVDGGRPDPRCFKTPPERRWPVPAGPAGGCLHPAAVSGRAPPGDPLRPGSPVGHRPFSPRTAPSAKSWSKRSWASPVPGCRSLAPGRPRSQNHGGRYFSRKRRRPMRENPLHPGRAPPADQAGQIHPYCYEKNGQPADFLPFAPFLPESR